MDSALMHARACAYAFSPSEQAMREALEASLPLCALIARRFLGRGAEYEDLYQVACMACVAAIKGFDPERGLQFSTYVTPTVTGAVRNYLRDKTSLLHTPRALQEQSLRLARAREEHITRHHQEPTARELAQALGWTVPQVLTALGAQAAGRVASLDALAEEDGTAGQAPFLEPGFERAELRQDLARALSHLTEQERALLSLRYEQGMSQREAAQQLQMSQMQVSRMEKRLLTALRKEMDPH